jgi:hypothetical protein
MQLREVRTAYHHQRVKRQIAMNMRITSQTLEARAGADNILASHTTGLSVGYMEEFRRERNVALTRVYGHVQRGDRCLVVPMGGGGDCIGASLAAYDLMRSFGAEVLMLGLTLKRPTQTNTSAPLGCLPISSFNSLKQNGDINDIIRKHNLTSIGLVTNDTRGPSDLLVDEVRLLKHCSEHPDWQDMKPTIGLLDPSDGITAVTHQLKKLMLQGGFNHAFFVDVGGDVITEGAEADRKTLWSPVLDEMMNFVAARLNDHIPTRTLVAGLGGDGEITHDRFIKQHQVVADQGGFWGGVSFPLEALGGYQELLKGAATETSRQILVALEHILPNVDRFGQFVSVQTHLNTLTEKGGPLSDSLVQLSDLFLFDLPVSLRKGTRESALNVLSPYIMSYNPKTIADNNHFGWLGKGGHLSFKEVVDEFRSRKFRTELDNQV